MLKTICNYSRILDIFKKW